MSLLPREHGAYGQVAFPIATALVVGGVSPAAVMVCTATVAGFLAHEPASVLLGFRGRRAQREHQRNATMWLGCSLTVGVAAGVGALVAIPAGARWSLMVPAAPALMLVLATFRGWERSSYGEIAGALAFSGVAVPITLASGHPITTALTIAIPFALLFVAGTLAVRVVILRVRRGGDVRATAATRLAVFALSGAATVALGWAAAVDIWPITMIVAATPGLATAVVIAARPPSPTRLRTVGWTLVMASVVTAVIAMSFARG